VKQGPERAREPPGWGSTPGLILVRQRATLSDAVTYALREATAAMTRVWVADRYQCKQKIPGAPVRVCRERQQAGLVECLFVGGNEERRVRLSDDMGYLWGDERSGRSLQASEQVGQGRRCALFPASPATRVAVPTRCLEHGKLETSKSELVDSCTFTERSSGDACM